MNKIIIDTENRNGSVVSKFIFGQNLEPTRSAFFRGICAQILRNRKFAGKPVALSGEAMDWYRIGDDTVYIALDTVDAYIRHTSDKMKRKSEINSQVIQNPIDGQLAGVGQDKISLKANTEYVAALVLKGRGKYPVNVKLLIRSQTGTIYAEKIFVVQKNDWERFEFSFLMPNINDTTAHFEIIFTQKAEIKIGASSLMPTDNFHGMRKDVISKFKEIGTTMLRWPGGNFSGEYNWKDGLLDVDMRAAQLSFMAIETHPYTHGYDFHEVGIDGFMALCKEINTEPYITVNLAWDSPEECAQWVEYCNGNENTEWGNKRIERGYKEPYNVKYWALGNELGLGHMEGPNSPESYTEKATLCAKAMKKVDSSIKLLASGAYHPDFEWDPWINNSLTVLCNEVEFLSYHHYVCGLFDYGIDYVTDDGIRKSYQKFINAVQENYEHLNLLREKLNKKGGGVENIKIAFDEWNIRFTYYHRPTIMQGINTALNLKMFMNKADELKMPICMFFQAINEGLFMVNAFDCVLSTNGQVFSIMKNHAGGRLLDVDCEDTTLHFVCTFHEDSGKVLLTVINSGFDENKEFSFSDNIKAPVKITLLNGDKFMYNGSSFDVTTKSNEARELCISPHSIMQLEFSTI